MKKTKTRLQKKKKKNSSKTLRHSENKGIAETDEVA